MKRGLQHGLTTCLDLSTKNQRREISNVLEKLFQVMENIMFDFLCYVIKFYLKSNLANEAME